MKKLELEGLEDDRIIVELFDDNSVEITTIDVDGDKSGHIFCIERSGNRLWLISLAPS